MKIFQSIFGAVLSLTVVFVLANCASETSTPNPNSTRLTANIAPTNADSTNTTSATSNVNSNLASSNVNVDTTNANNKTVSVGNVKRISFAKGASSGTTTVTLPSGSKQQFAIEATYEQ